MIGSRFEKQKERKGIDEYTVLMLHGEDFVWFYTDDGGASWKACYLGGVAA